MAQSGTEPGPAGTLAPLRGGAAGHGQSLPGPPAREGPVSPPPHRRDTAAWASLEALHGWVWLWILGGQTRPESPSAGAIFLLVSSSGIQAN